MEKLLHYVWKHKIFPLRALLTPYSEEVEVLDVGLSNPNSGPDFFNAKIKIGDTFWAGNVELHMRSSDWFKHGHDGDAAYNNTILHVVNIIDCEVFAENGKKIPQLQLDIPARVERCYSELCTTEDYPRCHPIIRRLDTFTVHSWMSALLCERLESKAELVMERVKKLNGDWENAFFITLARNFGFGLNGDTFESWGSHLPFHALGKHRDNSFQIESLFMGTAGLLQMDAVPKGNREAAAEDEYFAKLQKEYQYLAHKFSLPEPMSCERWQYLRLRPQNFPHLRIIQLAHLYHKGCLNLSRVLEAESIEQLQNLLQTQVTEYWETHYLFGCPGPKNEKKLSKASRNLLIINTVIPVLYAYGMQHDNETLCNRAIQMLEELRPENNYIIRQWESCGLSVESAADSQALIQLKKEYCDKKECLRCRFGYEFLKSES